MEKDTRKELEDEMNSITNAIFSFRSVLLFAFGFGTLILLLYALL